MRIRSLWALFSQIIAVLHRFGPKTHWVDKRSLTKGAVLRRSAAFWARAAEVGSEALASEGDQGLVLPPSRAGWLSVRPCVEALGLDLPEHLLALQSVSSRNNADTGRPHAGLAGACACK